MFKKIADFIKYHNGFVIVLAIAFAASASVMAASEDTRDKIIGGEIVEKKGIDNSLLLSTSLGNYDMEMKITEVSEDSENFYVDYQYEIPAIKDDVWQNILREEQMTVSKKSLGSRDLGLYAAEELGEIVDYKIAYLKKVQDSEKQKGETRVTEIKEYTGLVGMVIDAETKELPGYKPLVKSLVPETPKSNKKNNDEDNEQGSQEGQEEVVKGEIASKDNENINGDTDLISDLQEQIGLIKEQNDALTGFVLSLDIGTEAKIIDKERPIIGEAFFCQEGYYNDENEKKCRESVDEDNDGKDDESGKEIQSGMSVEIKTKAVSKSAKIFTSLENNDPGSSSWVEKVKDEENEEYIGFKILLSEPVSEGAKVNWWIIESAE